MDDFPELREVPLFEKTIYKGKLITISQTKVQLPNGKTSLREIVRHNGGVGIAAIDDKGNVFLVRQYRISPDLFTLEIPAGKLDSPAEDPLCAAIRELKEETGLQADRMEFLMTILPTPGYSTEKLYLYLATGLSSGHACPDADEFLSVVRMPLEQAAQLAMNGGFTDAKTALALLVARNRLQIPSQDPNRIPCLQVNE